MAGTGAALSNVVDAVVAGTEAGVMAGAAVDASLWRRFLLDQQAVFDAEGVRAYGTGAEGTAVPLTADVIVDLNHYGIIDVGGDDRQTFLHGLCTTDVRQLTPERSQFSAWCDAKGRVLATFWLLAQPDSLWLVLPRRLVPKVLARLHMYVLRAKVTLIDRSADSVRIGLYGQTVGNRLAEYMGSELPADPGGTLTKGTTTVVRMVGSVQPRWLLLGRASAMQALWLHLASQATPAGRSRWTLLNSVATVPDIDPATVGAFLPQMLGMEALGGLSFNKGCYPGQEVIARLHYRGRLTRAPRVYEVQSETAIEPGTAIHREDGSAEDAVGKVVSAAPHAAGAWTLLTVIQTESADARLRLGSANGVPIHARQHHVAPFS